LKLKLVILNVSILLAIVLTTGCSVTKEQAIASAKEAFEMAVSVEPREPNEETDLFSYYLPTALSIEEVAENNLILSKGNQLFLIFSNPAEDKLSKVNFEQDSLIENQAMLIETKEQETAFSYMIVSHFKDDDYKVIVGMGGEKGTTITDLANLKDSVNTLLEIIHSVTY
jgi:hypothetical protein